MKGQPGPYPANLDNSGVYLGRVTEWNDRELQLARLHEEMLVQKSHNVLQVFEFPRFRRAG